MLVFLMAGHTLDLQSYPIQQAALQAALLAFLPGLCSACGAGQSDTSGSCGG